MVLASLTLLQAYAVNKIDYARLSLPHFSKGTKFLVPSAPARFFLISDLFYMMNMFEQTVESELEDSSGEYENCGRKK